jgi:hypothetical protein
MLDCKLAVQYFVLYEPYMIRPILDSLFTSLPMIIVALGAIAAAFILWRRAPLSSLLVILASISSIALLIVYPFAYKAAQHFFATDPESNARITIVFGMAWSFVRSAYLIMLVVAVYAGRTNHGNDPTA